MNSLQFNYIITETAGPDSFDPLNADKTQNLTAMRMLYFTPFEVDKNNLLKSSIFESYNYDSETSTMTLQKKNNLYFEDGSEIQLQDIVLAILRMGYFRPDFPMIKDIIGIKEWTKSQKGLASLPQGIETTGNKIIIKFQKQMLNPMFRLCLELFSIVPSKCIDLASGKFICDIAPASGYFRIAQKARDSIVFVKRDLVSPGVENINVDSIAFQFKKLSELCKNKIAKNDVVAVSELDYISLNCALADAKLHWMAASRFGVLRFNTNNELFKLASHRRYFSELVRQQIDSMKIGIHSERSLLSPLLPGHLEKNEFPIDKEDYKIFFKNKKISLMTDQAPVMPFIYKAILETAKSLEMDIEIISKSKNEEIVNAFLDNRIAVIAGSSGFWAQDPVGDISMWFTKNLHKTMTFVWNDDELYSLLEKVENETTDTELNSRIKTLNRHIYNSAIISPLVHFRRLYITNASTQSLNLPQAIKSPTPWQISLADERYLWATWWDNLNVSFSILSVSASLSAGLIHEFNLEFINEVQVKESSAQRCLSLDKIKRGGCVTRRTCSLNCIGQSTITLPQLVLDTEVKHEHSDLVYLHRCYFENQPIFMGGPVERLCI